MLYEVRMKNEKNRTFAIDDIEADTPEQAIKAAYDRIAGIAVQFREGLPLEATAVAELKLPS